MLCRPKKIHFYRLNSAHRNTSLHAIRYIIFLVPKSFTVVIDADSFYPFRPFSVVLSSVMSICAKQLGQMITGSLDNGIWGGLRGVVENAGGRSCRPLCVGQMPLLVPAPPWAPWQKAAGSCHSAARREGQLPEPAQERMEKP